jgi:hypothetical protein
MTRVYTISRAPRVGGRDRVQKEKDEEEEVS